MKWFYSEELFAPAKRMYLEIKSFDFESKKKTETLSRWFEKVLFMNV